MFMQGYRRDCTWPQSNLRMKSVVASDRLVGTTPMRCNANNGLGSADLFINITVNRKFDKHGLIFRKSKLCAATAVSLTKYWRELN
jgi:hypothetical protein